MSIRGQAQPNSSLQKMSSVYAFEFDHTRKRNHVSCDHTALMALDQRLWIGYRQGVPRKPRTGRQHAGCTYKTRAAFFGMRLGKPLRSWRRSLAICRDSGQQRAVDDWIRFNCAKSCSRYRTLAYLSPYA